MDVSLKKITSVGEKIYSAVLDVVFPIACVNCENFGAHLCTECEKKIGRPVETCIFCGEHSFRGITCHTCHKKFCLSGILNISSYNDPILRKAVHGLKFSGIKDLSAPLGRLLSRAILQSFSERINEFYVAPLPLHTRRQRQRGFNQSELITQRVCELISLPCLSALKRKKFSQPQSSLNPEIRELRIKNIAGSFEINPTSLPLPNKVLLIDDVATTGATLEEAARVLREHGAQEIWAAVVCRG